MRHNLTAYEAALMILKMRRAYEGESGRELTRFRMSRKTLRLVAGRERVRDALVDELDEALRELGWLLFENGDHYCVLKIDRTDSWQRIASKRIRDELKRAQDPKGKFDFDALAKTLRIEEEPEEPDE